MSRKEGKMYLPKVIKKARFRKRNAWKKWKQAPSVNNKKLYNVMSKVYSKQVKRYKEIREELLMFKSQKSFCRFVSSHLSDKKESISLQKDDGKQVFNEDEICEIFAQEFTQNFCEPTIRTKSHVQSIYSILIGKSQSKRTVNIDYRSVLEVLLNCPHTAAGPDGLSGKLYHRLAYVLATPLAIIYQQSIYQAKIPSDWRLAKVIPLYKGKGNKSDATSYRPVSLTSEACKLLERLISQQIKEYLEATNALHNAQHGFRSNRSTTSNMLICDTLIAEALNERAECHVIIIDFKRAFDKIDHSILISKL